MAAAAVLLHCVRFRFQISPHTAYLFTIRYPKENNNILTLFFWKWTIAYAKLELGYGLE